ncbi:MAG: hypothetical protein KC478_03255 [Bacteriovoracaceae bacterium]|nr:hypothetical protein [Bacteriovoracaceae bacterium]
MENAMNETNKVKVKEKMATTELKGILQRWLSAIENNEDFELQVEGQKRIIPSKAMREGWVNVEVESKHGENEFEIELKWNGDAQETYTRQ